MDLISDSLSLILNSAIDVAPIALFLFVFHRVVIGGRIPNLGQILVGFGFVVVGLGLFLQGLEQTQFPLGRIMAEQLTDPEFLGASGGELHWSDFWWVYLFGAAIGFSTTLAAPALIAVAIKANAV